MTDRVIVYPGAIPLETDLLSAQVGQMVGLGFALETVLGNGTTAMGLACAPTSPASLSVTVGRGAITQYTVVDGSPFGDVAASSDPLLKIGVNRTPTTLTFVAPTSPGQSQAFLIQAQFSETDAVPVTLPYFNAANPLVSFSGPNNTGTTQYTQRIQRVLIQVKNGVPASTGSQTAPSADAGWVPLQVVTLANGATTVTSGNIALHPSAPFVPATVPQLGGALQSLATTAGLTFAPTDPTQEAQAVSIIGRRQGVYGSSATITVPAGVYRMRFRGWGGGGGGGSGNGGGGGGGAAGGAFDIWAPVSPGQSVTITIGAGGSSGVNGGTTVVSVNGVSVASAAGGGSGGLGTSGGIGAGSTYFGTASGAGYNLYGSSGSNGVASSSVLIGGAGGNANSFQGGPSQVSIAGTNAAGNGGQTGSGGGGGVGNGAGGAGGGGVVFVEY